MQVINVGITHNIVNRLLGFRMTTVTRFEPIHQTRLSFTVVNAISVTVNLELQAGFKCHHRPNKRFSIIKQDCFERQLHMAKAGELKTARPPSTQKLNKQRNITDNINVNGNSASTQQQQRIFMMVTMW